MNIHQEITKAFKEAVAKPGQDPDGILRDWHGKITKIDPGIIVDVDTIEVTASMIRVTFMNAAEWRIYNEGEDGIALLLVLLGQNRGHTRAKELIPKTDSKKLWDALSPYPGIYERLFYDSCGHCLCKVTD